MRLDPAAETLGPPLYGAVDVLKNPAKALRPHQWAKNTLVPLPLAGAHRFDFATLALAIAALLSHIGRDESPEPAGRARTAPPRRAEEAASWPTRSQRTAKLTTPPGRDEAAYRQELVRRRLRSCVTRLST